MPGARCQDGGVIRKAALTLRSDHAPSLPPSLPPSLAPACPSAILFPRRRSIDGCGVGIRRPLDVAYSRPGGRRWSNQGSRTAPCRREDRVYRQRIVPRARVDDGAAARRRSRPSMPSPSASPNGPMFPREPASVWSGSRGRPGAQSVVVRTSVPLWYKSPQAFRWGLRPGGTVRLSFVRVLLVPRTVQYSPARRDCTYADRQDACPTRSPQHKLARAGRGHHRCAALAVGDATTCSVPGPSSPSCPHHAGHSKLCRGRRRRSRGASAEDGSCVLMAVADQQQAFLHWGLHRGGLDRGSLEAALYPMRSVDERLCSGRAIAEPCCVDGAPIPYTSMRAVYLLPLGARRRYNQAGHHRSAPIAHLRPEGFAPSPHRSPPSSSPGWGLGLAAAPPLVVLPPLVVAGRPWRLSCSFLSLPASSMGGRPFLAPVTALLPLSRPRSSLSVGGLPDIPAGASPFLPANRVALLSALQLTCAVRGEFVSSPHSGSPSHMADGVAIPFPFPFSSAVVPGENPR
jgi:hypothetical protein